MTDDKIPQIVKVKYCEIKMGSDEAIELLGSINHRFCPITKGRKTVMSRKSFMNSCNHYRKIKEDNPQCEYCEIGEAIKNDEDFLEPEDVTFIFLNNDITKRKLVKIKKKCIIKDKDVLRIRKMYDEGYTLSGIHTIFPKISLSTVRRIAKRETWEHVK